MHRNERHADEAATAIASDDVESQKPLSHPSSSPNTTENPTIGVASNESLKGKTPTATFALRVADAIQRYRCRCGRFADQPLISGLDAVVLGTQPAAESVRLCGSSNPPYRYFFYMISGSLCDVVQFFIDYFIRYGIGVTDPSICWALGFGASIVFRHTSHRYLVFGQYVGGYWASLRRMYTGYSIIIVISTLFNLVMTKGLMVQHYVAWVITLLWTGIVNYFILKKLWSFGGKEGVNKDEKEESV